MPKYDTLLSAIVCATLVLSASSLSFAQTAAPPAGDTKKSDAPATPVVEVNGFRSAHFGMTEAEVRQAIATDFGIKGAAIRADDPPVDKTHVLSIKVTDVIPQGGTAEIGYVFGYKTRKLIQIAVTWSKASDDGIKPETLVSDAQLLADYFQSRGYKPESIVTNTATTEGLIVFRGRDAHDHMTLLLMRGQSSDVKGQRVFSPTSLSTLYIDDAQHQDVYRLPAGQF